MPEISISTYLPTDPAQAFAHVTSFPPNGRPDTRVLEERYGVLVEQEDLAFTFADKAGSGNRWRYSFDPPHRRRVQALDSNWSDRVDTFEASGEGTIWKIAWVPPSGGAPFMLRWLFFRWKDRKMLHAQLVQPVVEHFREQGFY